MYASTRKGLIAFILFRDGDGWEKKGGKIEIYYYYTKEAFCHHFWIADKRWNALHKVGTRERYAFPWLYVKGNRRR